MFVSLIDQHPFHPLHLWPRLPSFILAPHSLLPLETLIIQTRDLDIIHTTLPQSSCPICPSVPSEASQYELRTVSQFTHFISLHLHCGWRDISSAACSPTMLTSYSLGQWCQDLTLRLSHSSASCSLTLSTAQLRHQLLERILHFLAGVA